MKTAAAIDLEMPIQTSLIGKWTKHLIASIVLTEEEGSSVGHTHVIIHLTLIVRKCYQTNYRY